MSQKEKTKPIEYLDSDDTSADEGMSLQLLKNYSFQKYPF